MESVPANHKLSIRCGVYRAGLLLGVQKKTPFVEHGSQLTQTAPMKMQNFVLTFSGGDDQLPAGAFRIAKKQAERTHLTCKTRTYNIHSQSEHRKLSL